MNYLYSMEKAIYATDSNLICRHFIDLLFYLVELE